MNNDCVFCNRINFEERLVTETDLFYVIATLGQITDGGYVLLVPKNHIDCIGAMTEKELSEMLILKLLVINSLVKEYKDGVTIFEHGKVGQTIPHAHLHLVPAKLDLLPRIKRDFPATKIETFNNPQDFLQAYAKEMPSYLLWQTPNGALSVCWNPSAQKQYLRIVAAELLHKPERADWRKMDAELDRKLWSTTVTRLKGYF